MTEIVLAGYGLAQTRAPHHRDPLDIMSEAAILAMRDAGVAASEVDGVFTATAQASLPSLALAEHLGIAPRYLDSTTHGGSSNLSHIAHAAAAIRSGAIDVALVVYGSTQRTALKETGTRPAVAHVPPFEAGAGALFPIASYALMAARHMHEYGTTREQLSSVAVAAREWAALNPAAQLRDRITVEDVVASPLISSPFHKLDCCLITDGGGAIVVMSAERAAARGLRGVRIRGLAEASEHLTVSAMPDLASCGAVHSGRAAFEQAGIGPEDIDVVQIYDAFSINPLMILEDLGFCAKGEGGPFIEAGHTRPGGRLPVNTSGGGLAFTHPGMFGIYTVIEAMTQLRGEAGDRQVAARTAVAHGIGGTMSTHATLVLEAPAG